VINTNQMGFGLCGIAVTIAVGALIGWSVLAGNSMLLLVAVIVGMVLLYLCKSRVEEVIEDERVYRISEKASRRTLQVFGLTIAVIGIALVVLSKSGYAELTQAGLALVYSACGLLVLYLIFYGYYSRKYGG